MNAIKRCELLEKVGSKQGQILCSNKRSDIIDIQIPLTQRPYIPSQVFTVTLTDETSAQVEGV